jgi:hypothetical protein
VNGWEHLLTDVAETGPIVSQKFQCYARFILLTIVGKLLVKLPNVEMATVPQKKITHYLLDVEHESGRGKALFFIHFGFSVEQWQQLAIMLIDHAHQHEVVKQETTHFGVRYVIDGPLQTPVQRNASVRSVWFVPNDEQNPRFVTAYPLEELDND